MRLKLQFRIELLHEFCDIIMVNARVTYNANWKAAQVRSEPEFARLSPGFTTEQWCHLSTDGTTRSWKRSKIDFRTTVWYFRRDWAKSDQGGEFRDLGQTDDEFGHLGQQSATASAAESASTNAPRLGTAPATHFEGATTCCPYLAPRDPRQARVGLDPFPCLLC